MQRFKHGKLAEALKKQVVDKLTEIPYFLADGFMEYGQKVADKASEMAPRDTGALENSFIVQSSDTSNKDRFVVVVGVSQNSKAAEYAEDINDALYPAPPQEGMEQYQLGPRSRLKQKENADVLVGGLFLERALIETELDLTENLKEALK